MICGIYVTVCKNTRNTTDSLMSSLQTIIKKQMASFLLQTGRSFTFQSSRSIWFELHFLIKNSSSCLSLHIIWLRWEPPIQDNVPWRNKKTWNKRILPIRHGELMNFIVFWCCTISFADVKKQWKRITKNLINRWLFQQAAKLTKCMHNYFLIVLCLTLAGKLFY